MADAGFFKGTSADQDRRFSDKELKLLKSMKSSNQFASCFQHKVDMRKVNLDVIRPWITKRVVALVGMEDEVVVEYAMGLLEDKAQPTPDPRKMQINLTGFLTKDTGTFMNDLWTILLEAQESPGGVPKSFVEEKKEELRKARENDRRAVDESDRRNPNRGGFSGRGRGPSRFDDTNRRGPPPGMQRDSGYPRRGGRPYGRPSSRSRSPPPNRRRSPYARSRSPDTRRRPRSPSPRNRRRDSRSPSYDRGSMTPPYRRGHNSPPRRDRSYSRSPPPPSSRRRRRSSSVSSRSGDEEIKIKGQAGGLTDRENELKEQALREKLRRSKRASTDDI